MSDCSTNAMKPKRFEVCPSCEGRMIGNISEYEPSLLHLYCLDCECSVTRERPKDMDSLISPNVSKTHETIEDCPCESCDNNLGYLAVKTTYEKKEQRYQQLEQVAREMLHEMWSSNRDQSHIPEPSQDDYAEQLIALGVSVNE